MDLVISDIHADISGLNTIIDLTTSTDFKKKYGEISRILNLGDVLERGTNPKQVLEKIMELSKNYPVISVIGNHDEAFLYGRQISGSSLESTSAHNSLTEEDLSFFKKNQDNTFGDQEFLDKKTSLLCVHGGPLDPKKLHQKMQVLKHGYIRKVGRDYQKRTMNFLAIMDINIQLHLPLRKQKQKLKIL